ncbi:MAG: ribonuclease III [Lentisphaerae bacterium RIFOXYC12_FULL_60_16]|nr:MAG: ribonuclease III [Lentisphaerae bacterium RIFOXYC12_FULL_60_16]
MRLRFRKSELEKKIGYRFRDQSLLERAMIHPSYRAEHQDVDADNQRLEYLGDAVLGLLTATTLFRQFIKEPEGVLTSLRSQLTNGKTLAEMAQTLGLGAELKLGHGETESGGHRRPGAMADALEAVIGAVYLDGGMRAAEGLFKRLFGGRVETLSADAWAGNPKGQLQEYTQRVWKQSPDYRLVGRAGPAHAPSFTVQVELPDGRVAEGRASSRRLAEIHAAASMLQQIL